MIQLYDGGAYIVNGRNIISDGPKAVKEICNITSKTVTKELAKKGTIAYSIIEDHNQSEDIGRLRLKFDSLTSHDITYVGIIQTARASGMKEFPIPYVLTNCHNSLCAVGGTINEDDHKFALSAAKKYGGIYVPPHLSVIHSYNREMMAGCGKMILGSDSHTRYGALGTLAVGEGGGELVKQLLNRTYDVMRPEVIAIYLTGDVPAGVGPQDVALQIIGKVFKNGYVKNKVMEFIGDGISNLDVERRQYRFRFLNGSNSRFYNLKLSNNQSFIQIGSDGGFLPFPVKLKELLIAPGERVDILINFSKLAPGTKIILNNDAAAPFPAGPPPNPDTVGQIMRFTVVDTPIVPPVKLPAKLNNIPVLTPNVPKKILTLNVVNGPKGPLELLLDGQKWEAPISELPIIGSTVEWEIVNLTRATHPIHVHLIQFQLLNRQKFDNEKYLEEWLKLNGQPPLQHPTIPLEVEPFLIGKPIDPNLNERGWKDTIQANPGEVTRMILRFAPQDADPKKAKPGVNLYSFDPTFGPGYVWHCHILDHEDNEMMRPLKVINCPISEANPQSCCQVIVEGRTQLVPPALNDAPIVHKNMVNAKIEKVCPEKVVISGFVRRTINYTAVSESGVENKNQIIDDIPFQCAIDREDANEGDDFQITGAAIVCEVFAHTQGLGTNDTVNQQLAYEFVEKDVVKVCIRKGCAKNH